jgi:hypothetical protein
MSSPTAPLGPGGPGPKGPGWVQGFQWPSRPKKGAQSGFPLSIYPFLPAALLPAAELFSFQHYRQKRKNFGKKKCRPSGPCALRGAEMLPLNNPSLLPPACCRSLLPAACCLLPAASVIRPDCRLPTAIPTAICRLPTAIPTADCRLPTANCLRTNRMVHFGHDQNPIIYPGDAGG